ALTNDVAFMPGEPFFPEPDNHPGYLRLNFSHIDPARLDEGLKRLAAVVRSGLALSGLASSRASSLPQVL
ncbi:MAG: hypothetical protein AAAB23_10365, partial [Pseudomonas sp.]